jgi:hypothetical protein
VTVGIHDKLNSAILKILIYFLIMDHLAKQEHPVRGVFFQCFVTDFDGILNTVTKTKMAREIKYYWAKIQYRRREILLA